MRRLTVSDDNANPFDFPHDDPHVGPVHPEGPTAGGSITFDDQGHVTQLGLTVPGTGEGSQQATIDFGHGQDGGISDPGWMPNSGADAGDGLPDYFLQHPHGLLPGDDAPWIFDPGSGEQGDDQPGDYPDPSGGDTEIA
jgi:hypothetical protein